MNKNFFGLALLLSMFGMVQANVINWALPTLNDGTTGILSSDYSIAFLTDVTVNSGLVTSFTNAGGSNSGVVSFAGGSWGTWSDSLATSGTVDYYVAVLSGGQYYTINDANNELLKFTYDSSVVTTNPTVPDSGTFDAASILVPDQTTVDTVYTLTVAVPEPTTVLLGLAGLACLFPRRKKSA